MIPENWQALVDHALAARNHQANQLRVAENILTDILGDAADAGLSVTFLAQAAGLSRAAFYKRSAKTINSMRHATSRAKTPPSSPEPRKQHSAWATSDPHTSCDSPAVEPSHTCLASTDRENLFAAPHRAHSPVTYTPDCPSRRPNQRTKSPMRPPRSAHPRRPPGGKH